MPSRLLIAVGAGAASLDELPFGVRTLLDRAEEILVIAPALPKRLDWLTSATDKARRHADERLRGVLGQLSELDAEAGGVVGADDPVVAFEDAIREFRPDHLLIALRPEDRAGWQEHGLLDELLRSFSLPITVFELQP
jgi:hypothetical protein